MIEKLIAIQKELKVPKSQRNTFGNYNYRSCEDILEAVKPLLAKHNAALTLSDSLECIGAGTTSKLRLNCQTIKQVLKLLHTQEKQKQKREWTKVK